MSVSKSAPVSEAEGNTPPPKQLVDPRRNPAYPQRVHIHERPKWQEVLRTCDSRIAPFGEKLKLVPASSPDRPRFERLFAQMLGCRDQVADAARRLPGEVGDLYAEDRHRLEEALAALDRVVRQWEGK